MIPAPDVLVAVANPRGTRALALGDRMYYAAERHTRAVNRHEAACSGEGSDAMRKQRRTEMCVTGDELANVSREYEWLLDGPDGVDDHTFEIVDRTVWRDRDEEWAANRALHQAHYS